MMAFQAEGCGLPLRAILIKSALRIHLSVSYVMIGILRIGSLRSPPPFRLRLWTHLRREGSEVQSLTLIVPPPAVARELDSQGAAGD